jgi:hypothetical protein
MAAIIVTVVFSRAAVCQNANLPTAGQAVASGQRGGCPDQIAEELRLLRAEILDLRLAVHENRKEVLQSRLAAVKKRQLELRDEQTSYEQQLAELQHIVTEPLPAEELQQIMAIQADMSGRGMDKLKSDEAELGRNEMDLTRLLQYETNLSNALRRLLEQLKPRNQN